MVIITEEKFEKEWEAKPHMSIRPEYLRIELEYYADQISKRLKIASEETGVKSVQIKYDSLNWMLKKIMDDNGGYIQPLLNISSEEHYNLLHESIIDENEYSSLEGMLQLIFGMIPNGNEWYWLKETSKGIFTGVVILYQLWRVLRGEVMEAYTILKSMNNCPIEPVASFDNVFSEPIPHFEKKDSDELLIDILRGLKNVEWNNNRVKDKGLIAEDVSEDEWLYVLKGSSRDRKNAARKIPWKSKFACKSFVIQLLNSDYETAEKVFCLINKKNIIDIKGLKETKIDRRPDICDERNGKIAQIIINAMRNQEKVKSESSPVK